jgi:hypothetical protein
VAFMLTGLLLRKTHDGRRPYYGPQFVVA